MELYSIDFKSVVKGKYHIWNITAYLKAKIQISNITEYRDPQLKHASTRTISSTAACLP